MFQFKVCVAGRSTTFSFRVEDDYRLVKPLVDLQAPDLNLFRIRSVTVCTIDDGINKVYGIALQSKLDRFDTEVGRKLALARALATKGYWKGARALIWLMYLRAAEKELRQLREIAVRPMLRLFSAYGHHRLSKEPPQA